MGLLIYFAYSFFAQDLGLWWRRVKEKKIISQVLLNYYSVCWKIIWWYLRHFGRTHRTSLRGNCCKVCVRCCSETRWGEICVPQEGLESSTGCPEIGNTRRRGWGSSTRGRVPETKREASPPPTTLSPASYLYSPRICVVWKVSFNSQKLTCQTCLS